MMRHFHRCLAGIFTLSLLTVAASAQSNPVTAFSIERKLSADLMHSTEDLNIPAAIRRAVSAGALELRERLVYNPQQQTLTSTIFTVPARSPEVTPIQMDLSGSILGGFRINADDGVFVSSSPVRSILFGGAIDQSPPNNLFGDIVGTIGIASVGYTTDTPIKVNNVITSASGRFVWYSETASGTVTLPASGGTTPGDTADAPKISIKTVPASTIEPEILLDASATTDPKNRALTYSWTAVPGYRRGAILTPNASITRVQFTEDFGTYQFLLTVRNSAGLTSTQRVTIDYVAF
jgi:hypothetical protein